jgi:hypothetical protein
MQIYNNIFMASKTFDMLEQSQVFKTSKKLKETAKIAQINARAYQKQEQDFI